MDLWLETGMCSSGDLRLPQHFQNFAQPYLIFSSIRRLIVSYQITQMDPVTGGPSRTFSLKVPGTLGRSADADVQIDDPSVSRQHCRFSFNAYGELVVLDLGSVNGVYVRSNRVQKSTVDLGELIQIGALEFKIQLIEEPIRNPKHAGPSSMETTQRVPTFKIF